MLKNLDHVVISISNIDSAYRALHDIGFFLTPQGTHNGMATRNHLVVLDKVYFEILTVSENTEANAAFSRLIMQKTPGVSFKSSDVQKDHCALEKESFAMKPILDYGRMVDIDGRIVEAHFHTALIEESHTPFCFMFLTRHFTPEYIWRPEWQNHANRAKALNRVVLRCPDLDRAEDLYGKLFPNTAIRTDHALTIVAEDQKVQFTSRDGFLQDFPEAEQFYSDGLGISCLTITTSDLAQMEKALISAGKKVYRTPRKSLWVHLEAVDNIVIEFIGS